MAVDTGTRAGTVALIGLPNAGKSSLLNRLLGTKLSIVTAAAQTTRERVVGIDTREGVQTVFLDTPGIVRPAYLLHRSMVVIVEQTVQDADVVVLVLDGTCPPPELDPEMLRVIQDARPGLVPILNKVDLADTATLQELGAWVRERFGCDALRVSATTGEGIADLRARIAELLPESPFLYPEDELSSQPVRFFTEELIREAVFEQYMEEVPYSVAVKVDEFREAETPVYIRATVFVERSSQKAIVIGRKGAAIKDLGTAARQKIEQFLDTRVYLDLWVKVLPRWRKNALELKRFGFPVPEEETT